MGQILDVPADMLCVLTHAALQAGIQRVHPMQAAEIKASMFGDAACLFRVAVSFFDVLGNPAQIYRSVPHQTESIQPSDEKVRSISSGTFGILFALSGLWFSTSVPIAIEYNLENRS